MNQTRSCEHCGAALAADARFCETCGRVVSVPSAPEKSNVAAPSSATPRPNNPRWLIAGCTAGVMVIVCVAVIAAGGFFYFQTTTQIRATPTLFAILSPSIPTPFVSTATLPPPPAIVAITPTAAPSPTPKCPPTPALPAGVLFSDDFGSRQVSECKGWDIGFSATSDFIWSANKYTISVKQKQWLRWSAPDSEYDNFGAETQAQPVGNSYANYGLVFRAINAKNYTSPQSHYVFGISTDGKYSLRKRIASGNWVDPDPISATASPSIKPGATQNTLGVIVQGSTISLYINHALIKTITDNSIAAKGGVGVFAETGDNDQADVTFSQVTILTPEKAQADWSGAPSSTQPIQPSGAPSFSAVTFSTAFDDKAWTPINPGKVFPFGATRIFAYWTYTGVAPNTNFEYEWLFNNARVDGDSDRLVESSGKSVQWLTHPRSEDFPLDRGAYQFIIRVGGQVVISDTFVIQ